VYGNFTVCVTNGKAEYWERWRTTVGWGEEVNVSINKRVLNVITFCTGRVWKTGKASAENEISRSVAGYVIYTRKENEPFTYRTRRRLLPIADEVIKTKTAEIRGRVRLVITTDVAPSYLGRHDDPLFFFRVART